VEISRQQLEKLAELYAAAAEPEDPFGLAQRERRNAFDSEVRKLYEESGLRSVTLREFRRETARQCANFLRSDQPPADRESDRTTRD
jgi:hypothetical protein